MRECDYIDRGHFILHYPLCLAERTVVVEPQVVKSQAEIALIGVS